MAGAETSDANLNVVSVNAQHSSTIVTQTQQAGQVYELDTQPASTPIDAGQTFYSARLPYELCQIIMDCVALPLTDDITSHHRAQLLESVRSLVASLYLNPGLAALIDGVVLVSEKVPINTLLPVFAMVFVRRLTALRRLCLVDIKFGLGHRCSISLTSLGLWTLREFTSVTTLTLFHTVFRSPRELARILTSLYNVTTLHCRAVYFASAGQARYFVDHPPLRTTTLALHTGLPLQAVPHPFQAALEEAVSMVTLEDETAEFSCSVDLPRGAISDDPAAACPILRRSGAALRRLTLELMALEAGERVRHNQKLVRYYSLSCNTNLEVLRVNIQTWEDISLSRVNRIAAGSDLRWLTELCSTMSCPSSLRSLRLVISVGMSVHARRKGNVWPAYLPDPPSSALLDNMLSQPIFAAFQHLEFVLRLSDL